MTITGPRQNTPRLRPSSPRRGHKRGTSRPTYVYLPGTVDNLITFTQAGILSTGGPAIGISGRFDWNMLPNGTQRFLTLGGDIIVEVTAARTMSITWRDSAGNFLTSLTTSAGLPADFFDAGARYHIGFEITGTNGVSFYYRSAAGNSLGTAAPGSWTGWTLLEAVAGAGRSFKATWTTTNSIDLSSGFNSSRWCKGYFYGASIWAVSPATEFRVIIATDPIGPTGGTSASGHTVVITRSA